MKDIFCPFCNKQLIELSQDQHDGYNYSNYWCDECNADISIGVEVKFTKYYVEITEKESGVPYIVSPTYDTIAEAKEWYDKLGSVNRIFLVPTLYTCYVDERGWILDDSVNEVEVL